MESAWDYLLLVCGIYFGGKIAVLWIGHFIYLCRKHFFRWIWKINLISTYGPWAAITGATSGIGLGLAKELANQGLNIVLISRSLDKLQSVAEDIEKQYGVKTKVIACEASDRKSYSAILQQLADIDIGILVNNVGIISEEGTRPLCFHETRTSRVFDMNTVNCGAATLLMKGVLPHMMRRRRGLVVNLSSIASYYPVSYQAHYSATKIYLEMVSDSINEEIKDSGVKIKTLRPLIVQTKMTATNNLCYNSPLAQTPEQYSKHVLPTLASRSSSCGFWFADFTMWTFTLWPDWYRYCLVTYGMRYGAKYGKVMQLDQK